MKTKMKMTEETNARICKVLDNADLPHNSVFRRKLVKLLPAKASDKLIRDTYRNRCLVQKVKSDPVIRKKDFKVSDAKVSLTPEQIDLGAKYLAMSNICTLDRYRANIKDLPSLKRAVTSAWDDAVTGFMECEEGGYDDRHESKAIAGVNMEINSFKQDIIKGSKDGLHWIEELKKEIPFLFAPASQK